MLHILLRHNPTLYHKDLVSDEESLTVSNPDHRNSLLLPFYLKCTIVLHLISIFYFSIYMELIHSNPDNLPLTKITKFLDGFKFWHFTASSLTPRLSPLCSLNCSKRLPASLFPFIVYIYVQWYIWLDLHIRLNELQKYAEDVCYELMTKLFLNVVIMHSHPVLNAANWSIKYIYM